MMLEGFCPGSGKTGKMREKNRRTSSNLTGIDMVTRKCGTVRHAKPMLNSTLHNSLLMLTSSKLPVDVLVMNIIEETSHEMVNHNLEQVDLASQL